MKVQNIEIDYIINDFMKVPISYGFNVARQIITELQSKYQDITF